jgi:hypothetical protein
MQYISIRIDHIIALTAHKVDVRSMLDSCVNDLPLAQVIPAGETFLPEKIKRTVYCSYIDNLGKFLQLEGDLFGRYVFRTMSYSLDD